MRHDEHIIICVLPEGGFDASDQHTERGRYLFNAFRSHFYLRRLEFAPGVYKFNVVQRGVEMVTTFESLEDCEPVVHYESRVGNGNTSLQVQIGGPASPSWWTLPNFMFVCAVLTGILLWIVL